MYYRDVASQSFLAMLNYLHWKRDQLAQRASRAEVGRVGSKCTSAIIGMVPFISSRMLMNSDILKYYILCRKPSIKKCCILKQLIVSIPKSGGANIVNEFRLVWATLNKVPVGN